jgi:hypothetical protein
MRSHLVRPNVGFLLSDKLGLFSLRMRKCYHLSSSSNNDLDRQEMNPIQLQRSSYVNQINFGPEVDLIDSPRAQS